MYKKRFTTLISNLQQDIIEKDAAVKLSVLAAMAGESIFLLGPPGTAKSLIARRLSSMFSTARIFEYLMGRFSTPEEIFGPVSIKKLSEEDSYIRKVKGYLPDADVVFLDEIWKASPPIQNALLTVLNERIYRNGEDTIKLPLKSIIAASNELPEEEDSYNAFWDRFLLRYTIKNIEDTENFLTFLNGNAPVDRIENMPDALTNKEYEAFQDKRSSVTLSPIAQEIIIKIREALPAQAYVSDRRWKKILTLLQSSALINDRTEITAEDCFIIRHCAWTRPSDIDAVNEAVFSAIKGYVNATSINIDFSEFESMLEKLESQIEKQKSASKPVLIDGEYYEIEGLDSSYKTYIWYGDYEHIQKSPGNYEVFFYEDRYTFAFTKSLELTLQDKLTALHQGKSYSFKTEGDSNSQSGSNLKEDAAKLNSQLEDLLDSLHDARKRTEHSLKEHIFIGPEEITVANDALSVQISRLNDYLLRLKALGM